MSVSNFINEELVAENARLREKVALMQEVLDSEQLAVDLSNKIHEVLSTLSTRLNQIDGRLLTIETRLNTMTATIPTPIYGTTYTGITTTTNLR